MLYKAFISYSHAADARLAPALRSALRRIGRPWYRRAPFRIFLDESGLSANPDLWNSIEAALEQSEYLLLLASTTSARSEWVGRELDWWLSRRGPAAILILVTDGEINWRPGERDFDWEGTTALSPRLRGWFSEEPLWVDLRWARSERSLALRHKRFRGAVLEIAPPLYGRSHEDLDDEDLRHYRAARRMAMTAVILLAALVLGITVAARTAREERNVADCRALAAQATAYLETRLDLALLLGVESSRRSSCIEGRSALLTALERRPHLAGFLAGHTEVVTSVAFAPDGRTIASSSWDKTLRLWDMREHKPFGPVLKGMYGLAFSPDGSLLASADGASVTLWRMPDGSSAGDMPLPRGRTMSRVGFGPDGKVLAASNEPDGVTPSEVSLWDVATRQPLAPLRGVKVFAFSPDGKVLATEAEDGKGIVLRDLPTHRPLRPPLAGPTSRVRSIAFSPDGQMIAAGGEDHTTIVWHLRDRQPSGKVLTGQRAAVNAVAFNPEGTLLASGSGDGTVMLWDLEKLQPAGPPLTVAEKPVFDLAFSPDGRTLISNSENLVVLWDVQQSLPLGREIELEGQPTDRLWFSPDGTAVASLDTYGQVVLCDAETGRALVDPMGNRATAVAFSQDGGVVASVGWDGLLALWDRATGEPKGAGEATKFRLFSVAFSPNGRTLAAGGDAILLIWDIVARRWIATIDGQKDRIWDVAFSPDGKLLASAGNASFGLWDARTGAPVMAPVTTDTNRGYLLPANVAFSPGGRLLAYRQGGTGVTLWDVAKRRSSGGILSGHTEPVTSLAFSPDGGLLATGAQDGAVILWDVATRQRIGPPLIAGGKEIQGLAFRSKGRTLAALRDSRLLVWDVREESWREAACRLANRNLTREEWTRFFGPAAAYHETCTAPSFNKVK